MPVARQRLRAPAILRPWVDVLERYGGISKLPRKCLARHIEPCAMIAGSASNRVCQNHFEGGLTGFLDVEKTGSVQNRTPRYDFVSFHLMTGDRLLLPKIETRNFELQTT
ncbi:MAG: hypothetical protein ABJJ90_15170, partial [Lentilitoribacter sp.]